MEEHLKERETWRRIVACRFYYTSSTKSSSISELIQIGPSKSESRRTAPVRPSPPKSAQVHNLQWGSRRRATVNFRKIGMTARAFAFASLSPKPNLDANHSTWRGKHMLGISWSCRKCQRHPEAVKQSLTPRTHQRGMMKLCSEGEKKNKNNGQYRSTKTSMMTTEGTTTKSEIVVPRSPPKNNNWTHSGNAEFSFACSGSQSCSGNWSQDSRSDKTKQAI